MDPLQKWEKINRQSRQTATFANQQTATSARIMESLRKWNNLDR
jgi:hypothetical protein